MSLKIKEEKQDSIHEIKCFILFKKEKERKPQQ